MLMMKSMKIFNYEVRRIPNVEAELLQSIETNAKKGLLTAKIELRHHTLLLEQAEDNNRTEAEIKGYKDAIERDHKTINNWATQIRAIQHAREEKERE